MNYEVIVTDQEIEIPQKGAVRAIVMSLVYGPGIVIGHECCNRMGISFVPFFVDTYKPIQVPITLTYSNQPTNGNGDAILPKGTPVAVLVKV